MFSWTLLAGMLLGLLVKYLWFDGEERGKNVGSECTCPGINGTPHVLMVNATSHQRTENNSQRCSLVSTFHMVNIANQLGNRGHLVRTNTAADCDTSETRQPFGFEMMHIQHLKTNWSVQDACQRFAPTKSLMAPLWFSWAFLWSVCY